MEYAKLLKTTISANFLWKGDRVYITTKWQACGNAPFAGKVQIDFEFGTLRQYESDYNSHTFRWNIYPHMYLWEKGAVYETAGAYNIPAVWGGTRYVYISLLDDNNNPVPFINENGETVLRQLVTTVELGFEQASTYQKSFVKPIETAEATLIDVEKGNNNYLPEFKLNNTVCHPIVKVRRIENNEIITNIDNGSFDYTEAGNSFKITSEYASCTLACDGNKLVLNDVGEKCGYELLSVYIPDLCTIENSKVVNFSLGGRCADTKNNPPMGFPVLYDVINAMGIYDDESGILVSTDKLDFIMHQSIQRVNQKSMGVIGVELTNKVQAKVCGLKSPCVKGEKSVVITQIPRADWQSFAKELQKNLAPKRVECYNRCVFYKFMLDHGDDTPVASLDDLKQFYRESANIFDNQRQVVYIVGWQKGGHDHCYPEPFELNDAISSGDELQKVINEARDYNTYVSLHDNFEDAYLNCISDESLIAMDAYGEKYRGWLWSGGLSYIISLKKYFETGTMQKRVKWIVDTIGIKDTYHIDVTTSEMRRYDFSPEISCAADESLEYKFKIFEEFNKYGIDVTSETVCYPFIGRTGHGWSTRYNKSTTLYKNEEKIPLTPMLYHGIIPCGCFGYDKKSLLYGFMIGAKSCWGDVVQLDDEKIKSHYILNVPMLLIENMKITEYKKDGDWTIVIYEDGSMVRVNFSREEYEVIYKGKTIAKNWVTFAPGETDDVIYLYSLEDTEYSADCDYTFYELSKNGAKEIGKQNKIDLKAGVPVKGIKA
ncbi:MAG: DUF5696 domain-containing protein [Clostridia bacterium]|nr:DUF5696 domain-containing protein [Clostridia bacterium]